MTSERVPSVESQRWLYCIERMGEHCMEWHVAPCDPDWPVWCEREEAERQEGILQARHPGAVFRITGGWA